MNQNWEKIKQKLNLFKDKVIHWGQDNRSYLILSGLIVLFAIFAYSFYNNIIKPIVKKDAPSPESLEVITNPSDVVIIKDSLEEDNNPTQTTQSTNPSQTTNSDQLNNKPVSTSATNATESSNKTQVQDQTKKITKEVKLEESINLTTLAPINGSYVAGRTIQLAFTTNLPVKATIKSISLDGKTYNPNTQSGFSTSHVLPVKVEDAQRIDIILHIESANNQQKDILLTYNKR